MPHAQCLGQTEKTDSFVICCNIFSFAPKGHCFWHKHHYRTNLTVTHIHRTKTLGLSENVVYPIVPNGFADHYPYEKWLAIIGNINPTFSGPNPLASGDHGDQTGVSRCSNGRGLDGGDFNGGLSRRRPGRWNRQIRRRCPQRTVNKKTARAEL